MQPPVTARWQDIGPLEADEDTGELLLRLPTLTTLALCFSDDLFDVDTEHITHLDFLPQLPRLTSLTLYSEEWSLSPDTVLASLLLCSGLTELSISNFNSEAWSALFAVLAIKKLTLFLGGDIETLRCFASGLITESLEELSLEEIHLPWSELSHLYGLRRLRILHLGSSYYCRLDGATIDSLAPPTPFLPSLTTLFHHWQTASGAWDVTERQGSSFEWIHY